MSPILGISEEIERSNSEINKGKCLEGHKLRRPKSCILYHLPKDNREL